MAYSTGTTLLTTVSSRTDMSAALRAAAVLFVTVLTAVAAQISVPLPFTPVPFTLQPMIVLVGGAALGARLGMASQVIYLLAAFVAGWLAERGFDRRYLTSVTAMAAGLTLIFAFGITWFAFFAAPAPVGLPKALQLALYPFIGVDILKILLAATVLPSVWTLTDRFRR
jgi:biotin transport system substrate-specific component